MKMAKSLCFMICLLLIAQISFAAVTRGNHCVVELFGQKLYYNTIKQFEKHHKKTCDFTHSKYEKNLRMQIILKPGRKNRCLKKC